MENEGLTGLPTASAEVPVLNLQPLVDRVAESADIGTVVLILVIVFLIGLIVSERARNGTLTNNYMKQSLEVVKVLTSVKELMDRNVRYLEMNEKAVRTVSNRLHEAITKINLLVPNKRKPRTTKPKPDEDTVEEGGAQ